MYNYKNYYTFNCIWIGVIIPYHKVDYYMNTIDDMQNERDFFYHCNEFEYNHDFEQVFWKNDGTFLVFVLLDNNVYLHEIYYYKLLLLISFFDWI